MFYIFTALYSEASPLINFYNLKKDLNGKEFQQFNGENIRLFITGVGGIRVSSIFSFTLGLTEKRDDIFCLLIGVCGSKNKNIPVGDIFLINKAIQNDTKKRFYPDIIFDHNLRENSCESFNYVVDWEDFDTEAELIDMEAAYFLEAAQIFLPPHRSHVLKIVSDHLKIEGITKEFISLLVEKNIQKIDGFLKCISEVLSISRKEILSEEEVKILEMISSSLHLTLYMKKELFELYRLGKFKDNFSIEKLIPFTQKSPTTKIERKKLYEELKKIL